jgi:hypothetical protein
MVFGRFTERRLSGWTALFLATTVLASVTGFFFHYLIADKGDSVLPLHGYAQTSHMGRFRSVPHL